MAIQTTGHTSWRPLTLLLCASVGRSLVAIGTGLLVDGTVASRLAGQSLQPQQMPDVILSNVTVDMKAARLTPQCLRDLSACAALTGAQLCSDQLLQVMSMPAIVAPGLGDGYDNSTLPPFTLTKGNVAQKSFIAAGILGVTGGISFLFGAAAFMRDTMRLDKKRAYKVSSASFLGFILVVVASAVNKNAIDVNDTTTRNWMILPRSIGTFLIFGSIPLSFTTCELVNGNTPLPHREKVRQLLTALGPTLMLIWGTLESRDSGPGPVREAILALAFVNIILASALSQTTVERLAAVLNEPQAMRLSPVPEH
jgi:hypothetical protein